MSHKCCNHNIFRISNIKLTVKSQYSILMNDDLSHVLVHEVPNLRIIHVNGLAISFFRKKNSGFSSQYAHITGSKCFCEIEGYVLETLALVTNFNVEHCLYMRIGTVAFNFKVSKNLKSRLLKMSPQFYQRYNVTIPQRFPGIVIKKLYGNISALVFSSGSAVCVGAKRINQIYEFQKRFDIMACEIDSLLKSEG